MKALLLFAILLCACGGSVDPEPTTLKSAVVEPERQSGDFVADAGPSCVVAKLADERGVSRGEVLRGALSTVPTTTRTA